MTNAMRIAITSGLLLAPTLLAACAEGPPTTDDTGYVDRTLVGPGPDGQLVVKHDRITTAELELLERDREAQTLAAQGRPAAGEVAQIPQALTKDSACGGPSLWLFDAPNLGGRMLCLARNQERLDADGLINYLRFIDPLTKTPSYWAAAVRSFWAGSDPGYFRTGTRPFPTEAFTAFQKNTSVSNVVRDAPVVALHASGDRPTGSVSGEVLVGPSRTEGSCQKSGLPVAATVLRTGASFTVPFRYVGFRTDIHACVYTQFANLGIEWGESVKYSHPQLGTCVWNQNDLGPFEGPDAASSTAVFDHDMDLTQCGCLTTCQF
jgi:hypothetical protein